MVHAFLIWVCERGHISFQNRSLEHFADNFKGPGQGNGALSVSEQASSYIEEGSQVLALVQDKADENSQWLMCTIDHSSTGWICHPYSQNGYPKTFNSW